MGEKDVPTIGEYLKARIKTGEAIGFDGKVVTASFGRKLEKLLEDIEIRFSYEEDLADLEYALSDMQVRLNQQYQQP